MRMRRSSRTALFVVAACSSLGTILRAETVLVGSVVSPSDRRPMASIRHDVWNELLKQYVDSRGMVDYAGWKRSAPDTARLDAYLNHLSQASLGASGKNVRLAFWINAYNAVTIKGILREYPTSSIRNHTAKLFGYNIWKNLKLQIDGQQLSLDHIEHEILRKLGEPRIHFAIVCASIGCPRLINEAYSAERLDDQLTASAKGFFSDLGKFRFDVQKQTVAVSPILSWFDQDFGTDQAAQLRTIMPYVPESAQPLLARENVSVSYLDYDWSLNDQKGNRHR